MADQDIILLTTEPRQSGVDVQGIQVNNETKNLNGKDEILRDIKKHLLACRYEIEGTGVELEQQALLNARLADFEDKFSQFPAKNDIAAEGFTTSTRAGSRISEAASSNAKIAAAISRTPSNLTLPPSTPPSNLNNDNVESHPRESATRLTRNSDEDEELGPNPKQQKLEDE
ncbi:MAG: hypothetical protein Q9170_003551 [Blastenia crenularia]